MKAALNITLAAVAIFSAACQSGDIGKRSDYSDPAFDPTNTQIADRAKYLRALDPNLSEQEAQARATRDLAAERKAEREKIKTREEQDQFEKDLAKSVAK
jgi:hypothetical protein